MDAATPALIFLEQDDGKFVPITGNCTFGRSRNNTLVIESAKASRHHAAIHVQDGGEFWLIDLGSSNGTFLNDHRIVHPKRLEDGDRIAIGCSVFIFRHPGGVGDASTGDALATIQDVRSEVRWLLLADIEDFTPMSQQLDPRELATLVGKWVSRGREIVERNGGTMNKYLGDGYLACWAVPNDAPARIAAAVREFEALAAESEPKFRIIVHRGTVSICGSLGVSFGEEMLIGTEIIFTFRVEKFAAQCGAAFCFTAPAHDALGGLLQIEPIPGQHELKGFPGSYRFFRLRPS